MDVFLGATIQPMSGMLMDSCYIIHRPPRRANACLYHTFYSKSIPKTTSCIACWDLSVHLYLRQFLSVIGVHGFDTVGRSSTYPVQYAVAGFCQIPRTDGSMLTNFTSRLMSGCGNHGTIYSIEMLPIRF